MSSEISDYLDQSGALRLLSGSNAYGESAYASPATVDCRVQHTTRRVTSATGAEVVSETQVFLEPDQVVSPGALFDFDGRSWTVAVVGIRQGLDGPAFKIAYLGG